MIIDTHGGSIDAVARIIAAGLGSAFDENVIVEARPVAGGNIAAANVANAPADGHILLIASLSTLTTNPHLYKSLGFDPRKSLADQPRCRVWRKIAAILARGAYCIR